MVYKQLCGIIALILITISLLYVDTTVATPQQDGKFYFDNLARSMKEILTENQRLINTNPNGTMKNIKLAPDKYFREIYIQFRKTRVGRNFKIEELKGETDPKTIAILLTTLLEAGRITTARAQRAINTEADGSTKLKKFIPSVFGILTLNRFSNKTGIKMTQTTLGKGKYRERNPYNAPRAWEKSALRKISDPTWQKDKGYGTFDSNQYRYMKPIYITKDCLQCHGAPEGEKGPYGHVKEGYIESEVRGGISITLPI